VNAVVGDVADQLTIQVGEIDQTFSPARTAPHFLEEGVSGNMVPVVSVDNFEVMYLPPSSISDILIIYHYCY
jgi:hypothetical protein